MLSLLALGRVRPIQGGMVYFLDQVHACVTTGPICREGNDHHDGLGVSGPIFGNPSVVRTRDQVTLRRSSQLTAAVGVHVNCGKPTRMGSPVSGSKVAIDPDTVSVVGYNPYRPTSGGTEIGVD